MKKVKRCVAESYMFAVKPTLRMDCGGVGARIIGSVVSGWRETGAFVSSTLGGALLNAGAGVNNPGA